MGVKKVGVNMRLLPKLLPAFFLVFLTACWPIQVISTLSDIISIISFFDQDGQKSTKSVYPKISLQKNIDLSFSEVVKGELALNRGSNLKLNLISQEITDSTLVIHPNRNYLPLINITDNSGNSYDITGRFYGDGSLRFKLPTYGSGIELNILLTANGKAEGGVEYEIIKN